MKHLNCDSVTLFYDVLSVHSWVLFERLASIQSCIPANILKVRFLPVHAGNLLTMTGNFVPWYTPPLKKMYFEDIRFLAAIHRIPLKTPYVRIDEILLASSSSARPQMLLHWIGHNKGVELQKEASRLFWWRLWIDNCTIHEDADLLSVLKGLGISASEAEQHLSDLSDEFDDWGAVLRAAQEAAVTSKVFGLPWTVLHCSESGGAYTSYFGCDRWPLIRETLLAAPKMSSARQKLANLDAFKQYGFAL